MVLVLMFAVGALISSQHHYNECKQIRFDSPVCVNEQKMCKLGKDKSVCQKEEK